MLKRMLETPQRFYRFCGDVKVELKKVTWPAKKEVYSTTLVVIVTVFFFGAYLFLVDLVLKNGVEWVMGALGNFLS